MCMEDALHAAELHWVDNEEDTLGKKVLGKAKEPLQAVENGLLLQVTPERPQDPVADV